MQIAPTQPFRWDVTRRERLGSLVAPGVTGERFCSHLEQCAAQVLARAGNARKLYFVGRSPASIFDFLSGALADTSWHDRLVLLPFSMGSEDARRQVLSRPHLRRQMEVNFATLGLHPRDLQRGRGLVAFVDLVSQGNTYGNLLALIRRWTADEQAQWDVIRTKLRWVAITSQTRPSPDQWRWHQHAEWVAEVPPASIVNVALAGDHWDHLGNYQRKVTRSFPSARWLDPDGPRYDADVLAALATAVGHFEHGSASDTRRRLAGHLAAEPTFTERWLRSLAHELRRPAGSSGRASGHKSFGGKRRPWA